MRGSRTGAVLDRARPRDERAVTNAPTPTAQSLEATDSAAGRRFRTASRNRARIAAGLLLSVAAVSAVLLVFDNLDKRVAVLQVTRDVLAGEQVAAADLRVVEVSVDADVTVTPVDQQVLVVGSYAKVRIVAGALIAPTMLQPTPLVGPAFVSGRNCFSSSRLLRPMRPRWNQSVPASCPCPPHPTRSPA
jgi:flagella basal body P-ring formation protein FlgA